MKKILIGSAAIKHHYPEVNREPKDIDYAVDTKTNNSTKEIELLYNPILFKYCKGNVATPSELLSLKMSHLFWDINWDKHMWDVQVLLQKEVKPNIKVTKEQYKYWKTVNRKRHLNYNVDKTDFFNNQINYEIEHDALHHLLNPNPRYKQILEEGKEVKTDQTKLSNLSEEDLFLLVLEELQVMGYERFKHYSHQRAMFKMFRLYLINHAPFNIGIMMIKNYLKYIRHPFNFVEHLNKCLTTME